MSATPAPLDPSKVKAGDTVTLERDGGQVRGEMRAVTFAQNHQRAWIIQGGLQVQIEGPNAWTLTGHQPSHLMTEPQPRPDVAAILEGAGVDLDAVARRRELALTVTATVLGAAQAVIDHRGEPGAMARCVTLRAALDELRAHDPASAVVIAAALWADRPERPSAPERLVDLQEAVDALRPPVITDPATARGLEVMFAAAERPFDNPPCDVDPIAHEERLAYLEPDDGQD